MADVLHGIFFYRQTSKKTKPGYLPRDAPLTGYPVPVAQPRNYMQLYVKLDGR